MKDVMAGMTTRERKIESAVSVSPRLKKESVRIDGNGNIIDPRTKQIIERNTDV